MRDFLSTNWILVNVFPRMCSQIQEGEGNQVFKEAQKESCTTWFKEEIGILDGIWKIRAK